MIKLEKLAIFSQIFGLVKDNGFISIAGKSGTGKTTLALQFVSTLMTLEKPYRDQCVWIQASEQFPKRRLRTLLKSYPDKVDYVLKNIFVAPGIKPFYNYQDQSSYFRKLKTTIFPNNAKFIVIDNISHHLRFAASSHSGFKERGAILNEFFSVQLFPLIMRCLRENIVLLLIHEVSFDPTSGQTKPFFSKLYDRIDSINVNLSKAMGSGLKQMEVSSKGTSTKFVLELRELAKSYGKIIVIMGKQYQEIIKSELNSKFYVIFDKSGIYGYNKLLKEFEGMTKEQFLKKIKKYQK